MHLLMNHSVKGVNEGYITRSKLLNDHLRASQQTLSDFIIKAGTTAPKDGSKRERAWPLLAARRIGERSRHSCRAAVQSAVIGVSTTFQASSESPRQPVVDWASTFSGPSGTRMPPATWLLDSITRTVSDILDNVKTRGDDALRDVLHVDELLLERDALGIEPGHVQEIFDQRRECALPAHVRTPEGESPAVEPADAGGGGVRGDLQHPLGIHARAVGRIESHGRRVALASGRRLHRRALVRDGDRCCNEFHEQSGAPTGRGVLRRPPG